MSKFWSKTVRNLKPYVPGEQPQDRRYIKLNTNENPYPPSPKAIEAIKNAANDTLRLYPDPNCDALKAALAKYYHVEKKNIFVGNGSDEILALTFLTFFKQETPLLFPDVTYSFYEVYCDFFNIQARKIPVTPDLRLRLEDYLQPNGGIIFPNPNAPTGEYLPLQAIEKLLDANRDSVVAVDEAYIDFGGESAIRLIKTYPNLLVIQTFSKSRSLAGLRIGFTVGSEELTEGLERAKNSFNSYPLDRLAIAGGIEAVRDEDYFQKTRNRVIETRKWVAEELIRIGFSIIPSQANFLFIRHTETHAKLLYEKLREQGILVRYFQKPKVDHYLRVTVGTREEMETFIEKIEMLVRS